VRGIIVKDIGRQRDLRSRSADELTHFECDVTGILLRIFAQLRRRA
jgi:hypothetical protein